MLSAATDATIVPALLPLACAGLHPELLGLCVVDLWVRHMFMCCMSEHNKGFMKHMGGQVGGYMTGWTHEGINGCMNACVSKQTHERPNKRICNKQMIEWMKEGLNE